MFDGRVQVTMTAFRVARDLESAGHRHGNIPNPLKLIVIGEPEPDTDRLGVRSRNCLQGADSIFAAVDIQIAFVAKAKGISEFTEDLKQLKRSGLWFGPIIARDFWGGTFCRIPSYNPRSSAARICRGPSRER